jgi:hypothetical protein
MTLFQVLGQAPLLFGKNELILKKQKKMNLKERGE